MTRRFFSGSTLEQAVMAAARHHGIEPAELAYRQIEKRHGFLRTRKAVVISVDPDSPRHEAGAGGAPPGTAAGSPDVAERAAERPEPPRAPAAEPEPRDGVPAAAGGAAGSGDRDAEPAGDRWEEEAGRAGWAESISEPEPEPERDPEPDPWSEPRPEPQRGPGPAPERQAAAPGAAPETRPAVAAEQLEADDELLDAAVRSSHTLMRFAGIEAEATARSGRERIEVEIDGPDASVLVVEGGKGLLAIQHLLPRMLRGLTGRTSFVRVDSGGFHQQRRERLETLAYKEAEAATRSGTPRTLPPMAPDERRIVHLALKDSPAILTESRGSGLYKRVVIRPLLDRDTREDVEARHGL